jgi:hypothetical protein
MWYTSTPQCSLFICLFFFILHNYSAMGLISNQVDHNIISLLRSRRSTWGVASRIGINIHTVSCIRYMHNLKVSLHSRSRIKNVCIQWRGTWVQIAIFNLTSMAALTLKVLPFCSRAISCRKILRISLKKVVLRFLIEKMKSHQTHGCMWPILNF